MNIEEKLIKLQRENVEYTRTHIKDKEYEHKINELGKILNLSYDDVVKEVQNSILAAYVLSKNVKKQNITEKLVLESLQKQFPTMQKMPTNTSESIRFTENGKIVYGMKKNIKGYISKSVDYQMTYNGKTYYLTQKYTVGEGGAQDNQYEDAITFAKYATSSERDFGVGIVVDGNFYNNARLSKLKELFKNVPDFIIINDGKII